MQIDEGFGSEWMTAKFVKVLPNVAKVGGLDPATGSRHFVTTIGANGRNCSRLH